jgi:type I restriction enzyme, S subunit
VTFSAPVKIITVCDIKPPKKEAKRKLVNSDQVSFVPMANLGILTKKINTEVTRSIDEVYSSYTYFSENDVLLAKITPCFENGKLGIARGLVNSIGFGSSEFIVFRPHAEMDPEYLFYFLSRDQFRVEGAKVMTGAVGHKRIPNDYLESLVLPLPPLPKQKRIVAILDEAFDAIDQAIANTEQNLQNARELFESYLYKVFTEKGEGFDLLTIGECCTLKSGVSIPKNTAIPVGELPYVKVSDMSLEGNEIEIKSSSQLVAETILGPKRIFSKGTTIFPKRGGAIATNKKRITSRPIFADLNIMGVTPSEGLEPWYLYYFFMSKDMAKLSNGTTIPQINNPDIAPLSILVPPLPKQRRIVTFLNELRIHTSELRISFHEKLEMLKELKQSILQKAFTGELTEDYIEDWERI